MCVIKHEAFPLLDRDYKNLKFIVGITINYAQSSNEYNLQHIKANSVQSLFQAIATITQRPTERSHSRQREPY
ncbi:hypothetical protein F7734_51850 [Scytonema sp. UIC 10036]|uniref:hypothetical protein n=1 Tax=Scytonema sp. UIC 10036 TaxID=2304196 RepID=UPI0012DADE59|nr:hypothetical protein [Scytonema sp. UIC 10036]MUH00320.1 hypothetical protein [Scytonema sp. UIC 10036]